MLEAECLKGSEHHVYRSFRRAKLKKKNTFPVVFQVEVQMQTNRNACSPRISSNLLNARLTQSIKAALHVLIYSPSYTIYVSTV